MREGKADEFNHPWLRKFAFEPQQVKEDLGFVHRLCVYNYVSVHICFQHFKSHGVDHEFIILAIFAPDLTRRFLGELEEETFFY